MLGVRTTTPLSLWGLGGERGSLEEEEWGWGGHAEHVPSIPHPASHVAGLVGLSAQLPRWQPPGVGVTGWRGAVAPPVQLGQSERAPQAHHKGRASSGTHCFSKLIPHARLMNNVIKGAITLFLNAF